MTVITLPPCSRASWLPGVAWCVWLFWSPPAPATPVAAPSGNDTIITIDVDHPGAVINRNLYGQFAEFVGHGIDQGIWVGEASAIPNTRGFRNDVVAALRRLRVPLVRWPGGCFADTYHWRDGIGPRAARPKRMNVYWGGVIEQNAVGTHEFFDFLEQIGASAYINGNIGSGTPQEMADWVEYMSGDRDTSLVLERKRNGRDQPYKIAMFGIGNETWACGGNMRPEYSADLHRRYANFLNTPPYAMFFDPPPKDPMLKIASGSNGDDYHFTDVMMANAARFMDALTLHYYTTPTGIMGHFGASVAFPEKEWASTLRTASRIEELVTRHSAVMDRYDPEKRVGLFVDEWGTWYDPEPDRKPGFLFQQNTLRDAVVAAIYLDVFQHHADRVRMSSIAQMVNVLQSMILTDGSRMMLTPTYHVFRMHVPFQDSTSLPAQVGTQQYHAGDISLPAVRASAARAKDGFIYLALTNLDPDRSARIDAALLGGRARGATGEVLTGPSMDAHNDFEAPDRVHPVPFSGREKNGHVYLDLPAKSVAVLRILE